MSAIDLKLENMEISEENGLAALKKRQNNLTPAEKSFLKKIKTEDEIIHCALDF